MHDRRVIIAFHWTLCIAKRTYSHLWTVWP